MKVDELQLAAMKVLQRAFEAEGTAHVPPSHILQAAMGVLTLPQTPVVKS